MFRLLCLLVLTSLVAVMACSRDAPTPTPQPTATASPTGAPTATPKPTVSPTAVPSPPEPTPAPDTPTPAPTPSATPTTVPSRDDGLTDGDEPVDYYAFDPGSTVGDLYDTLSPSEQTCIGAEYSAAELAQLRERPVFDEQDTEGDQLALLECLESEKLSGVFYSFLAVNASWAAGELSAEQVSCLRQLADESDVLLIAGSDADRSPKAERALISFSRGLLACLPELTDGPREPSPGARADSVIWSFTAGGWVFTAPVVVDGVVYAGSDDGNLYALDADSGELLWSFETGEAIRSTAAVVDGAVYVGSNDNHLYALDAATGEELWRFDTGDWVQRSPAVSNGMVYFPARGEYDRAVHAVDAATGDLVWAAKHPYPIDHHVAPTIRGGRVYAQSAEYGAFYALDAATGKAAWQAEVGGYVESVPTVLDGVVYLTVINQAYAFDEATGELLWSVSTEEFPARDFPALVVDGIYYLAPGYYVHALDASTGEAIWSYDAAELSTPPVVAGGVLYGASELAEYLFALDARTGEVLWTLPTEDFSSYFLAVVDGVLYGQLDEGYLFAVDAGDGSILPWDWQTGSFSDVLHYAVGDGVVYWAGLDSSVYAHAAPTPRGDSAGASSSPPTPSASSTVGVEGIRDP